MSDHPLDHETVRSAVEQGDRNALARVGARILNAVSSVLGWKSKEIIEDAAADAMRKVMVAYAELDPVKGGSVDAWVYTVAKHVALDHLRKLKVHDSFIRDNEYAPDEEKPTAGAGGHGWCDARLIERKLALREAFAKLDADEQRILILRYCEGLTVRETAEEMRIPEGTVQSKCFRAAAQLREHIDGGTSNERRSGT